MEVREAEGEPEGERWRRPVWEVIGQRSRAVVSSSSSSEEVAEEVVFVGEGVLVVVVVGRGCWGLGLDDIFEWVVWVGSLMFGGLWFLGRRGPRVV